MGKQEDDNLDSNLLFAEALMRGLEGGPGPREIQESLPLAIHHLKAEGHRVWIARDERQEITGITVEEDVAREWVSQGRNVSEEDYGL